MKRAIPAAIILLALVILIIIVTFFINNALDQMLHHLERASYLNSVGSYSNAKKALEDFEKVYERNEEFLILFIKRDMVYSIKTEVLSASHYAFCDNKNDFGYEIQKAINNVSNIRKMQLRFF